MMRTFLVVALFAAASAPSVSFAQAIEVGLRGGFNIDGGSFVLVDVINRSSREVRGTLELSADENSGGHRFRVGADVPPRDRRTFQFETGVTGGILRARLRENDRVIGEADSWHGGSSNSIVVLADPPRVQASMGNLTGSHERDFGAEAFDYVTGTVDFNAAGDPIVPRRVQGWRGVGLVVATAQELDRLDEEQFGALREYVFSGGRVLISLGAPEEVRTPSVQRLAGGVVVAGDTISFTDASWQPEYFGGGRGVGFGYVWVCTKDINAPSSVGLMRVESLLQQIVLRAATVTPQLPLYEDESTSGWQARASFRRLRAGLDPNASFRPALGLVAVLLLLYVFAVGPLNFSYVQKRGKPTLALITTPILSFGCLVLMLLVGFIGKGVTMRHRSITWVESLAGETEGLRRTYRGLYSTRPTTFDLEPNGIASFAGNSDVMLVHEIGPSGEERLVDIRASLWSTTLVREEDVVPVGRIDFALQNGELESVTNRGEERLLDGLIVGAGGQAFELGDIAPGQTVLVPQAATFVVSTGGEERLARSLGFGEDQTEIVAGQLRMASVTNTTAPKLFVRVEHHEGTIALFAEETSAMIVSMQVPAQEFPLSGGDSGAWRFGSGPLTDGPVLAPANPDRAGPPGEQTPLDTLLQEALTQ